MSDKGGEGDAAVRQSLSTQEIVLNGSVDCNSHAIYGRDVSIIPSTIDDSMAGSNKVRISPIVSFDWPIKHYKGQQVAVDKSNQFIAYALKGRNGGIVRLIHRRMAERALIKGYKGLVVDLAFAHSEQNVLASLDDSATVFVHKVEMDKANHVIVIPMMQISYPDADLDMRVLWCCHIPDDVSDDDDEEDKSLLMATIIDTKAYVMNVLQLAAEHGAGPHQYSEISDSIVEISDHSQKVVLAAFSPDGSAIATASEDGVVHFYEVSSRPVTPRCLYKWSPHNGQPITMVYFLDDHSNTEPSVKYWRFAVTGSNNNTELKLWSCDNWKCLQTIRFTSRGDDSSPCLIANMDATSKYLILSDITQRVLYILQVYEDCKSDTVHICSISEFLLGAPVLSFAIVEVHRKAMVDGGNGDDDDDANSDGGDDVSLWKNGVAAHLAAVQPKNLQEMHINYVPQTSTMRDTQESLTSLTAASSDSFLPPDSLSDLNTSTSAGEVDVTAPSDFTTEDPSKDTDMVHDLDLATSRNSQLSSDRFEAAPGEDNSTDVPTSQMMKSNRADGSLEESVSLNQTPLGFADRSEESSEDTPSSGAPSAAASASVLLTPDAFISSVNKPPAAQEPLASPSSLTRVTPLPDNTNSLLLDGSAFDPGSVSTVSPGTLTPRSSVAGIRGTPPTALLLPPGIDAKDDSTEDTARQLEELFNSTVTEGNGPPLSSLKLLTEEDLLNETQALSRSISMPNQPLDTAPLSLPSTDPTKKGTYDSKIWPHPPEPPTERSESGDTDESDTNDEADGDVAGSSSEVESVNEELNVKAIERDVEQQDAVDEREMLQAAQHPANNAVAEKLSKQMDEMMAAILTINEQMMALGKDVHALKTRAALPEDRANQMSKQIAQSINNGVTSKMDQAVNLLRKEQRSIQDKVSAQTVTRLAQDVKVNLEKTVSAEIRRSVVPSVTEAMKPVTRDLHSVMAEKLTAADATLKEQLHKLMHSQTTIDKMGHAVGIAVQDVMLSTHRDSLTQHILPSFDASIRQAFKQMNSSMADGLNNYVRQVTDSMEKVKAKQMISQSLISESCDRAVEALNNSSREATQQMTNSVQKVIQKQVTQAFDGMKSLLIAEVLAAVRQEVESALQGQQQVISTQLEAIRSATATPAPDHALNAIGMKTHIDSLAQQKKYDQAFQAALSASDLSMVMYLLNQIPDSSTVLADPCPLSQPTLLSLIQQLSSGLTGPDLELKFSYLLEAVMNLDAQDAVTQQHMNKILGIALEKLTDFTAKNPSSQHRKTINFIEKFSKSALRSAGI